MDTAATPRRRPATCRTLAPARAYLPAIPTEAAVLGTLVRASPSRRGAPAGCGQTHLPAVPAGLLIWVQAEPAQPPGAPAPSQAALPAGLYLSGPRERPQTLTHAPDADLTVVMLRPEAWHARTHTDWAAWKDRLVPACEWCGAAASPLTRGVQACMSGQERARAVESLLHEGDDVSSGAGGNSGLLGWWQGLDARLAQRSVGERQRERLARAWTGLPPRMLRAQARAEAALVHAAALLRRNQLDWREVALLAGYTDQPHLCRETRRLTGFSPVQLMRGMLGDEAFWVYRAWAMARLGGSGPGWAG